MNRRIGQFFFLYLLVMVGLRSQAIAEERATRYEGVQSFLRQQAQAHSQTARLFSIGQSDAGVPIEGLAIGNGPIKNLVVATHHGNEYGSTEVAKAFAAALAAQPLGDQTVYVIPVLNVSGYNRLSRQEIANGQSFDPNRDYPGPCGTEGPFHLRSTAALARFIDQEGIVASATMHTFYPAVVYPWGIPTRDLATPYEELFRMLVQVATAESRYQTGNSTEVIYPATGTFEDYAFWRHGVWSLLFELGFSHSPAPDAVDEMIRVNLPGLRSMLAQAPRQRAERHEFSGRCDGRLGHLDRHDE